jgi:transcriptional regulator with XRE-family HTH domain
MDTVEDGVNPVEDESDGVESPALVMFAAESRAWREHLGWSQVTMGERIGYSDKLVSGIETRNRTPTLEYARACDRETGAPGTFERRHEDISKESFPPWFALVPGLEAKAKKIHDWDMRLIDGLIQTEDYARAVIRAGRPDDIDDVIERHVAARMERQRVFNREHPSAWFVIGEAVLRQVFGSRKVMRDQLDRLIELAGRPGITVQVLPLTAVNCSGADGPMTIFDMPDGAQIAYVEGCEVGRVIEASIEFDKLRARFDLLRAAALPPVESVRLIERIRDEYGKQPPDVV